MRQEFWHAYYSLQSVGLVPPIVMFLFMAKVAKTAEDKRAVRKWMLKKTLQFIGMFVLITFVLYAMQVSGTINLLAD